MTDWTYDIEVLPNVFTCLALNTDTQEYITFEISPRKNQFVEFTQWINRLGVQKDRMVGFNNLHYDYPIIHYMMKTLSGFVDATAITERVYSKSQAIFESTNNNDKFAHNVWESDHLVQQIDLFKIHHFDNKARSTSLKRLQFNMRLPNIVEFEVSFTERVKKASVITLLLKYNKHDVLSTDMFRQLSSQLIQFREQMSEEHGINLVNANDTKIGESYVKLQVKKQIGDHVLFDEIVNERTGFTYRKKTKGTPRKRVEIKDIIFDDIQLKTPEMRAVYDQLRGLKMFVINGKFHWNEHDEYPAMYAELQKVTPAITKQAKVVKTFEKGSDDHTAQLAMLDKLKDRKRWILNTYPDHKISCTLDGFQFDIGKGGLHGARKKSSYVSNKTHVIIDIDVKGMYPEVAITRYLYPQHLTSGFCPVYAALPIMRDKYRKGTFENALFKLAQNGSYGKTNSKYSFLFDPLYTMTTTINGQLMLMMLWEQLRTIQDIEIIQANTDGITFYIDRRYVKQAGAICRAWQKQSMLKLEQAVYSKMFTRDVNNYVCEYKDGSVKAKGAYQYASLYHDKNLDMNKVGMDIEWHKDHSMLVIQKAAEAYLLKGVQVKDFVLGHTDVYDFFACTNVNRSSKLLMRDTDGDTESQRVSRYLVSKEGVYLIKLMPPLNGGSKWREIGIQAGQTVTVVNNVKSDKAHDYDIDYQFYIDQTLKLVSMFDRG